MTQLINHFPIKLFDSATSPSDSGNIYDSDLSCHYLQYVNLVFTISVNSVEFAVTYLWLLLLLATIRYVNALAGTMLFY